MNLLAEFIRSRVEKHTLQALVAGFLAGVSVATAVMWSVFGSAAGGK